MRGPATAKRVRKTDLNPPGRSSGAWPTGLARTSPTGRFRSHPFALRPNGNCKDRTMTFARGLSAFPITPMNTNGRVDTPALRRLVAPLAAAKVDSIGLLGSTGSYPFLSRDERRRATEAAIAEVNGRVPVLVGIGALRTNETIELARDAKAAGAGAGLLAPVSYTPLTEDEVFEHFRTVAE